MTKTSRRLLTTICAATLVISLSLTATEAANAAAPANSAVQPASSQSSGRGGSQLGTSAPAGSLADKATQVEMSVTNHTGQTLHLTSATDSGAGVHWQDRATDLAPGQAETVSDYAAGNAEISLKYVDDTDNAQFTLSAETPLVGSNTAAGSSTDRSYTVAAHAANGYDPTDTFAITPGGTFDYTGQPQTYVVPAGITQLKITAQGGSGGGLTSSTSTNVATGAVVTGVADVTPGETLTIGAGGAAPIDGSLDGGWGLTVGNNVYSGGDGAAGPSVSHGGGGASVVLDESDKPLVVAGGGGGAGAIGNCGTTYSGISLGGKAGYQGSWTGQNGNPWPGGGGQAGGSTTARGQSTTSAGDCAGGAGGGGANGGAAGTTGNSAGGGAGASAAAGLSAATIETASSHGGDGENGSVVIASVS